MFIGANWGICSKPTPHPNSAAFWMPTVYPIGWMARTSPMVEQVHVDSTVDAGGETISAAQAMDNMEALIDEFPTTVTVTSE